MRPGPASGDDTHEPDGVASSVLTLLKQSFQSLGVCQHPVPAVYDLQIDAVDTR